MDWLTLRDTHSPVDQRDFDDRHDTRATSSDANLERYKQLMSHRLDCDKQLKSHRVTCDWHRTFQRLVTVSTLMILCVVAVVVVYHLVPGITIKEAMVVAGAAGAGPAAGYGLIVAGQALRRYRRRSSSRDDSSS